MSELERELLDLGTALELPSEPDLGRSVLARLAVPPRRRIGWRTLMVVLAAVAVALGAAFTVPQARSAILRFLGLEHVTIVRVEQLPPATRGPAAVGERMPLAAAERQLGIHALLPDLDGPDAVYVGPGGEVLILVYGRPVRVRLSEFQASYPLQKLVGAYGQVQAVRVDGHRGIWIPDQHVAIEPFGQPRLTGGALLWQRDGLTLRLEGRLTKEQALRLARSIRSRR
jgi:hypothetical protein